MAYNQENPFSRKSSPCSREKSLSEIRKQPGSSNAGKYPNVKEFCGPAGGAAKGTYPVNTKERIASAKKLAHNAPNPEGIIACADRAAEGMSRKSSSPLNADMTIVDEEKGKGESNYEAKHGDKKGVPASRKSSSPASRHGSMKGDQSATHSDYAHYKGTDKGYHGHTGASHGDQSATHRDYMVDDRQSPLSRTGWGAWELKYNAIDDITQGKGEADYSPANFGSWAHKDAVRAKKLYKEGHWEHAHDLGIDEHDADYAKHWHKDEAEHGPSRHASIKGAFRAASGLVDAQKQLRDEYADLQGREVLKHPNPYYPPALEVSNRMIEIDEHPLDPFGERAQQAQQGPSRHVPGHIEPTYNRGYNHSYIPGDTSIENLRLGRSLKYPSSDPGGLAAEDTRSFRLLDHEGGMTGYGSGRGIRKTDKANKTMAQIEALRAAGGNERNIARKIAKLDKTIEQIDPSGRMREAADQHGHGGMYGYTSYRDFLNSPLNNKGHVGDYDGHVHLSAYKGGSKVHKYDDGAGGIDYEKMARDTEARTELAQSNIDSLYLKNLQKIQPKKMKMTKDIKPLPQSSKPKKQKVRGKAKEGK